VFLSKLGHFLIRLIAQPSIFASVLNGTQHLNLFVFNDHIEIMKRTLKFSAVALLAVVVLWACGGSAGPKSVGESFLSAMAKGDIEGAKKFASKESQASLEMMAGTSDAKKANPDKIEVGDVKEEGDKATLSYKENGADKTLSLVKEDGAWKAAYSKGGNSDTGLEGLGEGLEAAMDSASAEVDSLAPADGE
jgi:hypothetical protein